MSQEENHAIASVCDRDGEREIIEEGEKIEKFLIVTTNAAINSISNQIYRAYEYDG